MSKLKINLDHPEVKAIWETALAARREVASWPAWKRGESPPAAGLSDTSPASSKKR